MPKKTYTVNERRIMRLLYQTKAPLTVYGIAKELRISFVTARKYVKTLIEKGMIKEDKTKKPERYIFNFDIFEEKK